MTCTAYKYDDYIPILSLTILCPIFCIIAHSPYIAIAYLDDGSHASSIFIYYSILGYVTFGLLWLFFHWCENFEKRLANILEVSDLRIFTLVGLVSVIVIFLGLVVTITCYFVLIPINKSISDAPNRVISIYQSGGFVIGSFIVYKIVKYFYKKNKGVITIEHIHEILHKRLPRPFQQQFHQLQQQYNQFQLELQLTPQRSQNQVQNLQRRFYEQPLQSLRQAEQQLLQQQGSQGLAQQQQQPQGQPQDDRDQQSLRDLQQQLHGIQQEFYQVLLRQPTSTVSSSSQTSHQPQSDSSQASQSLQPAVANVDESNVEAGALHSSSEA